MQANSWQIAASVQPAANRERANHACRAAPGPEAAEKVHQRAAYVPRARLPSLHTLKSSIQEVVHMVTARRAASDRKGG